MSKEITIDVDVARVDGNYVFTSPEVDTLYIYNTNYDRGVSSCEELLNYIQKHVPDQIPEADEETDIKINIRRLASANNDMVKKYKNIKEFEAHLNERDDDDED